MKPLDMKAVALASLFAVAALGLARADGDERPGSDWMSIPTLTQKLHDIGFTDITKIEADDGLWEAKGYKNGVYTKVKLDPRSGAVVSEHRKDHHDDDD